MTTNNKKRGKQDSKATDNKRQGRGLRILLAILFVSIAVAAPLIFMAGKGGNEDHESRTLEEIEKKRETEEKEKRDKEDALKAEEEKKALEEAEKEEEKKAPATLVFTGDVELSSQVQANLEASGTGGMVDDKLLEILRGADVLAINNEFAFSTRGTAMADKEYTYRVDPKYVTNLTDMGVDCAGLANNHALDFGKDALIDTFSTLEGAGIKKCGAGNSFEEASAPAVFEVNGETYAILAASRVIPVTGWNIDNGQPGMLTTYDPGELVNAIKKTKESYDHVFVMVHWGVMYEEYPQDYQKNMARQYIDAGADGVFGAHPHVLQGIEYYKDKPIFYSLGNFIFFNNSDPVASVSVTVDGDKISCKIIPSYAVSSKTYLAEGDRAKQVYSYLQSISSVTIDDEGNVIP